MVYMYITKYLEIIPIPLCLHSIPGPFGERDEEQVFIQRVIPETSSIFIRHSSTGNRYIHCTCIEIKDNKMSGKL